MAKERHLFAELAEGVAALANTRVSGVGHGSLDSRFTNDHIRKAMSEVTLSSKHQIVVPREAREALGLKPGSRLQVVVRGRTVILMSKPKNAAKALAGAARRKYPSGYLDRERATWP